MPTMTNFRPSASRASCIAILLIAAIGGPAYAVELTQANPAPSDQSAPSAPASTPAPHTPAANAPPAPAEGTPATVVDGKQVESILGRKVRSASGDDMGRVVDLLFDKAGQLRAAIIDFGGFLGVGSRQIAIDWSAIKFPGDAKSDFVTADLTRDQLRVAPAYKAGEQIVVLGSVARPPAAAPGAEASSAPDKTTTPPKEPDSK